MKKLLLLTGFIAAYFSAFAQIKDAPVRTEGEGPFTQLILRGAVVIDGTGAPAFGPADIVIEKNRIVYVAAVGSPGTPIRENRRPKLKEGGKEIDCKGMYILPGFIDIHGHIGGAAQGTPAEYVFKLWMGHGITTIREPGSMNGLKWTLNHKRKSQIDSITAPRIFAYTVFGQGAEKT
ncbi:MAG: amidohydrolase, partial [Sphingobacteriales bacterium]